MIIKSILLENFRPYYGQIKIDFCSGEKNITLLKAENGSGKTTLLEAMKWGLYGGQLNLSGGNDKEYGSSSFINKKYLHERENELVSAKVELKIIGKLSKDEEEREYTITREIFFQDNKHVKTDLVLSYGDKRIDMIDLAQAKIKCLLPQEIDFFVDGERLEQIAPEKVNQKRERKSNASTLQEAINRVLGIKSLENAVLDVGRCLVEYKKDYDKSAQENTRVVELANKIDELEKKYTETEILYSEKKEEIESLKEEKEELDKQLKEEVQNSIQDEKLKAEINIREKEVSTLQAKKDALKTQYKRFLSVKGVEIVTERYLKDAYDVINEKIKAGDIPFKYAKMFLEKLLESGVCICGTHLSENSEEREEILRRAAEATTSEDIAKVFEICSILKSRTILKESEEIDELKIYKIKIAQIAMDLAEKNEILKTLFGKTNKDTQDQYEKIESLKNEKENKIEQLSQETGGLGKELEIISDELSSIRKQKQEADRKNKTSEKERKNRDFCAKILESLKALKEFQEEQGREELKEKIEEVYSKINKKGYRVELTKNFEFKIFDTDDQEAGTSKGEAKNKALSFIGGLIYYAKELNKKKESQLDSNGGIYPLVLDAPYGDLDNEYRLEFSKMLPILSEQVIIMVSSGQWSDDIENEIKNQIGKKYSLVNERRTGDDKKYDVTRVNEEL